MPSLRLLALAAILALAPRAATGSWLEIPGIPGESADEGHKGWIPLESWRWDAPSGSGAAASGRGAGEHAAKRLIVVKKMDKSSAAIREALARGTRFPTVTLDGGKERIVLKNVMIAADQTTAGSMQQMTESVTLVGESMEIQVAPPPAPPAATMRAAPPMAAATLAPAATAALPPQAVSLQGKLLPAVSPAARSWVASEAQSLSRRGLSPGAMAAAAQQDAAHRFGSANLPATDIDALVFLVMMDAAQSNQKELQGAMAQVQATNAAKAQQRGAAPAAPAKGDSLGDLSSQQQLQLQQMMDRRAQFQETLSNIMKSTSGTASALVQNLK